MRYHFIKSKEIPKLPLTLTNDKGKLIHLGGLGQPAFGVPGHTQVKHGLRSPICD